KPIFLGAFTNLDQVSNQTNAGYNNLFAFAKATPYIAGVDLHIHHGSTEQMTTSLNFANERIREDQKILVTEFSLMKHWINNNNTALSTAFIAAANANTTARILPPPVEVTKNYQYSDHALKKPAPAEEWYAYWN